MNNKTKTLIAIKVLIFRYTFPWFFKNKLFRSEHCPLCKIHKEGKNCKGCPMAYVNGNADCANFESFYEAKRGIYKNRIKFHKELYKICKKEPKEQFTKEGWRYLKLDERK